ncbi:MAG: SNARE associated protein [Cenarchaeum symbiont of Oopsacas minuta]|nr:SNARE associated protein [Cenarchaeum symbiont of Oopsacas minuta]
MHALAIISAVFAASAKLVIFYIGYNGRRIMHKSTIKRMRPIERIVKKYGAVAAFIAAATPIPDDLVYIPLGIARYNPLRFFIYTLAGKFVISYVTIILSHFLGPSVIGSLSQRIDNPSDAYIAVGLLVVILFVIVILMLFLDWTKFIKRFAPWALEEDEERK